MVDSQKLGAMASSCRLLTGVSRVADGLVIITKSTGFDVGELKRMATRILSGRFFKHDVKEITAHHLFDFEIDSVAAAHHGGPNAAAATDNEGVVSSLR